MYVEMKLLLYHKLKMYIFEIHICLLIGNAEKNVARISPQYFVGRNYQKYFLDMGKNRNV